MIAAQLLVPDQSRTKSPYFLLHMLNKIIGLWKTPNQKSQILGFSHMCITVRLGKFKMADYVHRACEHLKKSAKDSFQLKEKQKQAISNIVSKRTLCWY